jgi:hypothetical protein
VRAVAALTQPGCRVQQVLPCSAAEARDAGRLGVPPSPSARACGLHAHTVFGCALDAMPGSRQSLAGQGWSLFGWVEGRHSRLDEGYGEVQVDLIAAPQRDRHEEAARSRARLGEEAASSSTFAAGRSRPKLQGWALVGLLAGAGVQVSLPSAGSEPPAALQPAEIFCKRSWRAHPMGRILTTQYLRRTTACVSTRPSTRQHTKPSTPLITMPICGTKKG